MRNGERRFESGLCMCEEYEKLKRDKPKWEKERKRLPHGGLESMQYSRSWSCSIGGWVMSAIVVSLTEEKQRGKRRKEEETEEEEFRTK